MKNAVSQTSLESYDALQLGRSAECQRKIVGVMQHGQVYSRRQLSLLTGLETSCVSGRCRELLDDDVLEVVGEIKCPVTGRRVEAVALAPVQMEFEE